jgi:hypothetical protein
MLAKFSLICALLSIQLASATYIPRQQAGTQFITGPCGGDAECASGCCGFNTGRCAGAIIALERDGGCGFGDLVSNDNAARVLRGQAPANPPAPAPINNGGAAPAPNTGGGLGTQFITGPCDSDADCASGCCGFNTGKCAGAIVALERDGGCGFGDLTPNDNAARVLRGQAPASPATPPPPPPINNGGAAPAPNTGSGKALGTQFITGPCGRDAECASGCCGFNTGKCAGAIVALERDGGCGFGDSTPNDNAAQVLRGQA